MVEMRGDGKVAGVGEAFEDALDVLVHAPRFLENYYRMSRFTRRIRSADGQRYVTCGRRESSHVPTVCEYGLYSSTDCGCTVKLDSSNVQFRRSADQPGQLADARRTFGALREGARIGAGRPVDQT
ncbi:hypothetical protein rerp_52660 [Rhodococcus erythropolis]|nr:hypothetical protein rerp_52660 [Rhodococcus erythropolis]